jgi:acetyl/propionyl-CoA carboxylase alpha subunit
MAVTVTDLAVEVKESNQRLTAAIEHLNVEVAKINVYLSFIRVATWVAIPVMISLLVGGIGASYKIVWDTARVHAAVESLQADAKAQRESLDRIERALAQNRPSTINRP